mmetsp:Transcript_34387/g.51043  ORF Transcript_34387/g.51043 Transcript_34387/m.51043 type:complete len:449 (-) Transcript_34387:187-1533(-)|eukprot:CAMPEP_0194049522 /NCGR_PEP_ID=MMETSP0009_2-20130614/30731_1 /TAXON_ID=210454 /ORGANISM="Grammatophora oceanica, Strain CCMP 410" /LENGTH=448 /DNA_ID=CAMNT_0038695701 /DNA_START=51 /DNA_END=1397 /DNA_ORIENTATION=+
MGQVLSLPFKLCGTTFSYWRCLGHYLFGAGRTQPYLGSATPPALTPSEQDDTPSQLLLKQHGRVHLFGLASAFWLYNKKHYRKGSYAQDLQDNLRNVAIPGTGLPLSWFVPNRLVALGLVGIAYPAVACMAAFHKYFTDSSSSISEEYALRLFAPNDWFSYWRLNCNVVGMHALLRDFPIDYEMENKWTFLKEGADRGVPISPFLDTPGIVVKHRNEEGGMGIHFYKNATDGGDWIIQERILNSAWVSSLLPQKAPLSTFRVITQSRGCLLKGANNSNETTDSPTVDQVTALSCVFRAGRENALTDHDSILFDVDVKTGRIGKGTTNAHWYRLGLWDGLFRCPWRSSHDYTHHPDNGGAIEVTGKVVPDIKGILTLVEEAHAKMCPTVPLAGWDVVLSASNDVPVCLLEVNLSCNFFRGSFDTKTYLDFMEDTFRELQAERLIADNKN